MLKKIFLYIYIIVLIMMLSSCKIFSYPKVVFDFKQLGDAPPYSASERLKLKDKYSQEIMINFIRGGNEYKTSLNMIIFIKKPYKYLNIKNINYLYANEKGEFLNDAKFKLPEYVSETEIKTNYYYGKDGYYWTFQVKPLDKKKGQPKIDFQKIFKHKKPGDKFKFKIEIEYSFDDEPVQFLTLQYEVTAAKGRYISPLDF